MTLRGVVEFLWTAKLKKGIKSLSSVPVNVLRKRALRLIFHVVVVQLSLMARAKLSFWLLIRPATVSPSRYRRRLSFA